MSCAPVGWWGDCIRNVDLSDKELVCSIYMPYTKQQVSHISCTLINSGKKECVRTSPKRIDREQGSIALAMSILSPYGKTKENIPMKAQHRKLKIKKYVITTVYIEQ